MNQQTERKRKTAWLIGLLCVATFARASDAAEQPNILLITTDDQGLNAGCYGDALARTPNIDALAKSGVRFTRAYVAQASCSSSRSTMLTGLYPHQNGQIGLVNDYAMHEGIRTLPAMLKDAGYRTGLIGKLHVKPVSAFPWDFWEMKNPIKTRHVREVASKARKFMDACGEQPFFLMVNFFDPHRPYNAEANQCDGLPGNPRTAADVRPLDFMGVDVPELRAEVAAYYNAIERADAGIGLLMQVLEDRGLAENTLVISLGDHGAPFTRAKTTCYEAGEQVPFVVRWPEGGRKGLVRNELVSSVDLVPTLLELAHVASAKGLPGQSLVPLLKGKTVPWRMAVFSESTAHRRAHYYPRRTVRTARFKLVHNLLPDRPNPLSGIGPVRATSEEAPLRNKALWDVLNPEFYQVEGRFFGAPAETIRSAYSTYRNPPGFELYDLENDPFERTNLAGNPEYGGELEKLTAELAQWQRETADPFADPKYLADFTEETDRLNQQARRKK